METQQSTIPKRQAPADNYVGVKKFKRSKVSATSSQPVEGTAKRKQEIPTRSVNSQIEMSSVAKSRDPDVSEDYIPPLRNVRSTPRISQRQYLPPIPTLQEKPDETIDLTLIPSDDDDDEDDNNYAELSSSQHPIMLDSSREPTPEPAEEVEIGKSATDQPSPGTATIPTEKEEKNFKISRSKSLKPADGKLKKRKDKAKRKAVTPSNEKDTDEAVMSDSSFVTASTGPKESYEDQELEESEPVTEEDTSKPIIWQPPADDGEDEADELYMEEDEEDVIVPSLRTNNNAKPTHKTTDNHEKKQTATPKKPIVIPATLTPELPASKEMPTANPPLSPERVVKEVAEAAETFSAAGSPTTTEEPASVEETVTSSSPMNVTEDQLADEEKDEEKMQELPEISETRPDKSSAQEEGQTELVMTVDDKDTSERFATTSLSSLSSKEVEEEEQEPGRLFIEQPKDKNETPSPSPPDSSSSASRSDTARTATKRPRESSSSKISTVAPFTPSSSESSLSPDNDYTKGTLDQVGKKKTRSAETTGQINGIVTYGRIARAKRIDRRDLPTGYVYDVIMSYHKEIDQVFYEKHPEDPRRISYIYLEMKDRGLLDNCVRLQLRKATKEEVLAVHQRKHYTSMKKTADLSREELVQRAEIEDSIYLNAHSFESALYSAGGVIAACDAVLSDKVKNAFAIVRPPGHHAEAHRPMGFCLFNNVAIAIEYCKKHYPMEERIMVLDWDVHFGNGTQQLTDEDPNVLYVSLHRYEDGQFYPSLRKGDRSYVGSGAGKGKTINIPWPRAGMTDGDYLHAFRQIVIPVALEFNPSLVIVSAGFDAALGDTIGECNVTPAGYGQMTHMLKAIANGRLVLALEGGYNLNAIAHSAAACMAVLTGEAPETPTQLLPSVEAVRTVDRVKRTHSAYWQCLQY